MQTPRKMVWGGHASRAMVAALLAVHAAALIWLCGDTARLRLIGYDFKEVTSEAFVNSPPETLRAVGYTEDDPSEFATFRAIAEPLVAGSPNDVERIRRLGDYIYSLRVDGAPDFMDPKDQPLANVWRALRRGDHGSCAEMSLVLAAFWRSLGGHTRGLRWTTAEGRIGHVAVRFLGFRLRRVRSLPAPRTRQRGRIVDLRPRNLGAHQPGRGRVRGGRPHGGLGCQPGLTVTGAAGWR